MKFFIICLMFPFSTYAVDTVDNLDIDQYLGRWYEIASIPQSFQKDCYSDTTADYELVDDDIKVTNTCLKEDSTKKVAEGRARVNSEFNQNSKLEVTFVNILGFWVWSFSGNYWVLNLDENYQWSVVGDPSLEYLWILSRTPELAKQQILELRDFIEEVGYDSCKVLLSRTSSNMPEERTPLCDLN